jgi:uncharacterized integral membrane protein (TIGR00698 family)
MNDTILTWRLRLRFVFFTVIGLFPIALLAGLAFALDRSWPLLGTAALGLLFGLAVSFPLKMRPRVAEFFAPGIGFASKTLLQTAVALLGLKVSLVQALATGRDSIFVTLGSLSASFIVALAVGRLLKIEKRTAVLIGTGTAICGASAIAAAGPTIGAKKEEYSYAFSVIFLFNVVALFVFPAVGRGLGLGDSQFGLWAGTAINDTSSVVAAAYSWSGAAGDHAVVVKLTRTLFIIPVTLVLGLLSRRGVFGAEAQVSGAKVARVPWFLIAFVILSAVASLVRIDPRLVKAVSLLSSFFICMALTAIGVSTDVKKIRQAGWRPLVLGLSTWAAVAFSSLGLMYLVG